MAQTTHGVPYPLPDEPVAEGAARIRDVAEALDSRVLAGRIDWGPAGAATDVTLQRWDVNTLRASGVLLAGQEFYAGGDVVPHSGGAEQLVLGGLPGYAAIFFGSARDTALYRNGANALRTDGSLTAAVSLATGGNMIGGNLFATASNGAVYFGPASDTILSCPTVGQLQTSGDLIVGGSVYFGPAGDTSLSRYAAGIIKTESRIVADGFGVGGWVEAPVGGSNVRKVPIYDAFGSGLLGYMPLYSA